VERKLEKVKVRKNKVEVTLNRAFYNYESVLRTKKDFSRFAKVLIKKFDDKIVVVMKPKTKVGLEKLGYEFYNYLLNMIKEMKLRS
jgi:hypothetical protein